MAKDRLLEIKSGTSIQSIDTHQSTNSLYNRPEYSVIDETLSQYGEIRQSLAAISENLEAMAKLSQTFCLRKYDEVEMDNLRTQNLKIGHQLMVTFKDLQKDLPNDDDFTLVARIKRTLFYGLHQRYINLWRENEAFLQSYEAKLKKNLTFHSKLVDTNATEEQVEELIANKTTSLFVDNILEDTEKERHLLGNLMERLTQLKKLEKSIEDVHALFLRIQNLVFEQNDRIQVVEYHAQQATVHVDKGAGEMAKAHDYKKKATKKMTCLIIFSTVIIFIILVCLFI